MNATRWIESRGIRVWAKGDSLTLEGLAALEPEQASEVLNYARQNKAQLLDELRGPSDLPWPEPDTFPLVVRSEPWKYACLFAIASVYGAGLTKDAGGRLVLTCPATMPQGAAQAAQEGLAELSGYLQARLAGEM